MPRSPWSVTPGDPGPPGVREGSRPLHPEQQETEDRLADHKPGDDVEQVVNPDQNGGRDDENGENREGEVHLGDIAIGDQLIAMQRALDEGAVTEAEHRQFKRRLLGVLDECEREAEAETEATSDDESSWTWF